MAKHQSTTPPFCEGTLIGTREVKWRGARGEKKKKKKKREDERKAKTKATPMES